MRRRSRLALILLLGALLLSGACVWIWGDNNTTDQRSGIGPGMQAGTPSVQVVDPSGDDTITAPGVEIVSDPAENKR